ncbi:hypothetical protein [Tautonia plasticadhaerens]|uniref:hypothetical protein n=1 Tax=Tautonia plasticadhaerens TaxID=2527974 RepID=UPI00119D0512|nr:hypothetical protein [Tautonia plasticadhaerens]
MVVLALGVVGSLTTRGLTRRLSLGFILAGGVNLATASEQWVEPNLPTSKVLGRMHPAIRVPQVARTLIPRSAFGESYSAFAEIHPEAIDVRLVFDEDGENTATIIWTVPTLEPFRRIGHCLIALLLALFCGTIVRLVSTREERRLAGSS